MRSEQFRKWMDIQPMLLFIIQHVKKCKRFGLLFFFFFAKTRDWQRLHSFIGAAFNICLQLSIRSTASQCSKPHITFLTGEGPPRTQFSVSRMLFQKSQVEMLPVWRARNRHRAKASRAVLGLRAVHKGLAVFFASHHALKQLRDLSSAGG